MVMAITGCRPSGGGTLSMKASDAELNTLIFPSVAPTAINPVPMAADDTMTPFPRSWLVSPYTHFDVTLRAMSSSRMGESSATRKIDDRTHPTATKLLEAKADGRCGALALAALPPAPMTLTYPPPPTAIYPPPGRGATSLMLTGCLYSDTADGDVPDLQFHTYVVSIPTARACWPSRENSTAAIRRQVRCSCAKRAPVRMFHIEIRGRGWSSPVAMMGAEGWLQTHDTGWPTSMMRMFASLIQSCTTTTFPTGKTRHPSHTAIPRLLVIQCPTTLCSCKTSPPLVEGLPPFPFPPSFIISFYPSVQ
eukprot:Sspe_Gene.22114::Locus_8365_Transcript_1_1_Confidence_1.000_Length_3141::g.22114::m.22114